MLWDKLSCFSFGQTVPATASTNTSSKIIDFKLNKGLDDQLRIFGMIKGAPLTSGTITCEVQHCDTVGGSYVKVADATLAGNKVIDIALPRNLKRFVKLVYKVGSTALNRAVEVWSGLVPESEVDGPLTLQNLNTPTGPEDLNVTNGNLV
ncbi:MAG: hypothetical protein MJZ81_07555 [Bacteroidales bacterium]|nr:hypothetical protein [Bacteroidales bacterium]